jgi:hypothetical protein
MRLFVDTSRVSFMVSKPAEPKVDQTGQQRHRKDTGAPMWTTQVTALDETGAEVISITVAGVKPEVAVGDNIAPVGLEAIAWATNGRHGVAFRAEELQIVQKAAR